MNDPPDIQYYSSTKNTFTNIVKKRIDDDFMETIFDVVTRINKIVFHTYNFIKLYILYGCQHNMPLPLFNVMNAITYKKEKRGAKPTCNKQTIAIGLFYEQVYKPLLKKSDIVCRDGLKHVLNHEEADIIKNITTNIKEHYLSHLRFFIKIYFQFDKTIEEIKKSKLKPKIKKKRTDKISSTISLH